MESDSDNDLELTPPNIREAVKLTTLKLLPGTSKKMYQGAYNLSLEWRRDQNSKSGEASKSTTAIAPANSQGLATLIVMIAVLTIIILFCCLSAPGIRDLCKRHIFRTCVIDDPEEDNASTAGESATPTIILLPYGRMLVVDRTVFAQLQADHTGIDFMELSANLIRAQRYQTGSTPSILDSENTSKGLSPMSLGVSPPAYEDIFGDKNNDLPPSYSEVSLMFRTYSRGFFTEPENIEMRNMNVCNERNVESNFSDTEVNNENNLNKELDDENARNADNNSVHIAIEECDPSTSQPNSVTSIPRDIYNDCSIMESSI